MRNLYVFAFLLYFHPVYSQTTQIDTLSIARDLATSQKFKEANILLAGYNAHNTNMNALLQQAQLLYWLKKPKEAIQIFERTLLAFPNESAVQQAYGKFLFEYNKLSQARVLLNKAFTQDAQNLETIRMLGYIDLWAGRIANATTKAALLEQLQPGNSYAADILQTISNYTTPVLTLNGGMFSDDQPLKRYTFDGEAAVYRSWLFAPYIGATLHQFDLGEAKLRTAWIRAGNKFYISSTKTNAEISVGAFRARERNIGTTYKLKLIQKISSSFSFDVSHEKKPYQYTLASIRRPFVYTLSDLGLDFNRKNRWLGRAAYQHQNFADTNSVSTVYAWLLAPVFIKKNVSIKAGYGYSNSDAKENNFRPKQINGTPTLGDRIEGIYDPYFTPFDQTTHSLLASVNYSFTKKVSLASNMSFGLAASAYQPYHVLEGNNLGQLFINKAYSIYNYNPVEFSTDLKAIVSRSCSINFIYQYNSLIFFKSHFVNLQIKYLFLNAKQKI